MKKFRKHVISSFVKKFAFATFAVFASCTTVSASFEDFLSTLDQAGFDTQTMIESSTISRYDTARLLNIIECEDCINPSLNMIRMYTPEYRSDFSSWPQNAFHDIGR
ncbi:MAG: hypothetical protein H6766_00410 [Candidatus Peribacteria bacterium]|nr:MAG: hypothetical protein H6766_00410 [Candidatus Peribacteria bacterium]